MSKPCLKSCVDGLWGLLCMFMATCTMPSGSLQTKLLRAGLQTKPLTCKPSH
jgi:hypothetical protein